MGLSLRPEDGIAPWVWPATLVLTAGGVIGIMAAPAVAAAISPWIPPLLYLLVIGTLALAALLRFRGADLPQPPFLGSRRFPDGPVLFAASVLAFCAYPISVWHEGRTVGEALDGIGRNIAGSIPWLDAGLYVGGAQRLLFFSELDDFGSRRPLAVMYHAALQSLAGLDIRWAMVVQAVLLGAACYLATKAVKDELGPLPGLAMFAAFFGHAFFSSASTLSEAPGAVAGGIAFAVLWRSAAVKTLWPGAAGLFLLAVALEVRAGPATILVALPIWFAWHLRGTRRLNLRVLVLLLAIALSGTLITRASVAALGGRMENLYGSSAYVLYGMAKGDPGWTASGEPISWQRIFNDHPELYGLDEVDRGPFIRKQTGEQLRAEPGKFVSAYFGGAANYLVLARDRILAPIPPGGRNAAWILVTLAAAALLVRRARAGGWPGIVVDAALMGGTVVTVPFLLDYWYHSGRYQPEWLALLVAALTFGAFGVLGSARLKRQDLTTLSVACLIGLVVSIPLLGADGFRVFGAVVPMFSLPFILSVAVLRSAIAGVGVAAKGTARGIAAPVAAGAVLVVFILAGAPLAMSAIDLPKLPEGRCADGSTPEPLYGGISLSAAGQTDEEDLERLNDADFARALAFFGPFVPEVAGPGAPTVETIVSGVTATGSDRIAFVREQVGDPGGSVLLLCGRSLSGPYIDTLRTVYPVPFDFYAGQIALP